MNRPGFRRRWVSIVVELSIVAILAWFVRGTILGAVAKIRTYPHAFSFGWLAAAALLYLAGLLPEGLFWHRVLRDLGQEAELAETLRAYFIGHLGKYVPGKAMVVVLRTGLIRSHRVDTRMAVASVFLETLTMMAVGACVAAAILAVRFSDQPRYLVAALGHGGRLGLAGH